MYQVGKVPSNRAEQPQTRLCRCKATYKMGDILHVVASTVEVGGAQSDCKATPTAVD